MRPNADTPAPPPSDATPLARPLGWALLAFLVVYTAGIHQGLAPAPGGMPTEWWHPTGFLRDAAPVAGWVGRPLLGTFMLTLPAAIATLLLCLATRSAVGRAIGTCSIVSVAIMGFYGLSGARRIWEFFHWRGSLVILATGVAVGCTLAAPWLAGRWLRLRSHWKLVSYAPVFFAVASIIRNATGTDENLFFNFSPWPAIPVLGLEIGCYTIVGLMIGAAAGLTAFAGAKPRLALRIVGFASGAILPVIWFGSRFSQTRPPALLALSVISAAILCLALIARGGNRHLERRRRAIHLAVGAALVAFPLLSGRALADRDYALTRHDRAQILIDALARYYRDEYEYPEHLSALVEGGYLAQIPKPRIGFQIYYDLGWLDPLEFDYQSLGSSYVLEFVSTEWVMCAYNPPWDDEEGDEEDGDEEDTSAPDGSGTAICESECREVCEVDCDEDDGGACGAQCATDCAERCGTSEPAEDEWDREMAEAWSCPDKRPELW